MCKIAARREKKAKGNQGERVPAASKPLVAAKSVYEKAAQTVDATKLAAMMKVTKAFELYGNLLSDEARQS